VTIVDKTTEPAGVFDAHLARWEAAEADPDGTVERVARAIAESEDAHTAFGFPCRCGWMAEFGRGWEERVARHRLAAKAAAAIDALRPAPDAPRVDEGAAVAMTTDEAAEVMVRKADHWYWAEREICGFASDTEPPCVKSHGHDGDCDGTYHAPAQERLTAWLDSQIGAAS
jgi:hypothetical protein